MGKRECEKAVHVKEDRNGRISVEVQFPDPSANPYLALTAILAAGLEGIEKALVLDEEAAMRMRRGSRRHWGYCSRSWIRMNLHTVYLGKSSAGCTARARKRSGNASVPM